MSRRAYLAIDIGASGGRHLIGLVDDQRLSLSEVYRFTNGPVAAAGRLYWDLLGQWQHVRQGLRAAASAELGEMASVGVDTWGVDFGLLGRGDELLGNPVHYRDPRTDGLLERAFAVVPRDKIFAQTGLQFMQFNTLYQLWAMRLAESPLLDVAESLLMMPDLFHWLLTGEKSNEMTNATTTQFFNPVATNLGARPAQGIRNSHAHRRPDRAAGNKAGPLAQDDRQRNGTVEGSRRSARHARHGQRRGGRSRGQRCRRSAPTGAISARAPGR